MKILTFAATNSRNSINRSLIEFSLVRLQLTTAATAEIELVDLNDFEMPIYSIDRETKTGIPQLAHDFFNKIGTADAVIVSFAEHNGTVTAAWKNIFDWMSRIDMKVWQGKPLVFLAATTGPRAGAGVLSGQRMLAPFFGADLRAVHGFGKWPEAWDAEAKTLTQDADIAALDQALKAMIAIPTSSVKVA